MEPTRRDKVRLVWIFSGTDMMLEMSLDDAKDCVRQYTRWKRSGIGDSLSNMIEGPEWAVDMNQVVAVFWYRPSPADIDELHRRAMKHHVQEIEREDSWRGSDDER